MKFHLLQRKTSGKEFLDNMENVDKMIKDLDETNNTLNCILTNSGGTFGSGAIPLENVSGAIDRFQQESNARKKDINDLKGSLFVTRSDLLDIITKNYEEITKKILRKFMKLKKH